MHLRIYQENPTVRAVVHAHPRWPPPCRRRHPPGQAGAPGGGGPTGHRAGGPFALPPGSQGVADSVAPFCRDYRALLLEYHGAVTWGTSMEQAHYRLECLERVATVTLHLHTLGCHRVIPLKWWRNWRGSARRGGFYSKIHPCRFFGRGGKRIFMNLRKDDRHGIQSIVIL